MVARPKDLAHDDVSLVVAAQAGDAEAFSELFRRHYSPVKRVVARKLGNLRDADEIAQAAFVRAYERIDRCAGDRRFGAWVQVIANNLAVDHLRAQNRTQPSDEPVQGDAALGPNAPEDALMRREQSALVHRALDTLPDRQRDVVVARDMEGRRPPEIAAALGLTVGAVDSILLRARRRLADTVQSMAAETGATSVATTGAVTATGAAAHSSTLQRMVQAVSDLVARVSYQLAASVGMVPGADSAASQAAQAAAAGLLALVPVGGAAAAALPDSVPAPDPVTATIPSVVDHVDPAAAAIAPPPVEVPPAEPAPAAPTVESIPAPAPPAPEAPPEQEGLVRGLVSTTVETAGGVASGLRLTLTP